MNWTTGLGSPPLTGGESVHVLLLEADPAFAAQVRGNLEDVPGLVEVGTEERVSAALARLVRRHWDLIVVDLELPDSRGIDTVRSLRRAAPDVPIVVLSGNDDVGLAVDCIREGAAEYVVKARFTVESLIWLVRLVLERHRRALAESPRRAGTDLIDLRAEPPIRPALEVIGRYLLRLAARTHLEVMVAVLELVPEPRGPRSDLDGLLAETAEILGRTLRRCDVISRTGSRELAVLAASANGRLENAIVRVADALIADGLGPCVRLGLVVQAPDARPVPLDELLAGARDRVGPVISD